MLNIPVLFPFLVTSSAKIVKRDISMKPLMVSVSGVRGIVGESLTPDVIARYTSAFGTMCNGGTVVVGRDTRVSGPMVEQVVRAALMAAGCTVIPLGISTTPTVQMAVPHFCADGGIVITASHNPTEWNALKFLDNKGMFIDSDKGMQLQYIIDSNTFAYTNHSGLGTCKDQTSYDYDHIKAILCSNFIMPEIIRKKQFKVVVDCVNGAASSIFPLLLEELGCDVIKLHCEPNGHFPRGAESLPENITELGSTVLNVRADIGFALDPDGDRLAVVDESGIPLGEEYTIVLATTSVLEHQTGSIAANVSTTSALDDVADRFDVTIHRSAVGEAHVVKKMIEAGCIVGGEGNGGVIFPDIHYGRDALVGASLVLRLCAERGIPMSAVKADFPRYYMTKLKLEMDSNTAENAIEEIRENPGGAEVDITDGLKLIFPSYWVHIRKSNTEPIIRVIVEAQTKEKADKLALIYLEKITSGV